MTQPMRGPGDRYTVRLQVLAARGDGEYRRSEVTEGELVGDQTYVAVADDLCTITLGTGENGLTLKSVKLLRPSQAVVTACVTPGSGAPDWLPNESAYLLFDGDRAAAQAVRERYMPLAGMADERAGHPVEGMTPLDRLAVAVGRSVARANAVLAQTQAPAGVALVSQVTLRVGVKQTDLGGGRVLVTLAQPGDDATQFVELTMGTAPGARPPDPDLAPGAGVTGAGATGAGAAGTAPQTRASR